MGIAEKLPSVPSAVPRPRSLRPRRLPSLLVLAVVGICAIFYLLLSIAPCMVGKACYHGYYSRFSFDADDAAHPRWMADLPDSVNLTALSIPGTHDTMTYNMTDDEGLQCQRLNLTAQLNAGIRYFDIRARLYNDELRIYHASGYTGFTFTDVLLDMFAFLDENPSEALIMRLKEEGGPLGDTRTRSFEEVFNYYLNAHPDTSTGAAEHLELYDRLSPLPTLGSLRGRIFLIQNFKAENHHVYGMAWEGTQMILEDYWIIADVYHLADKWTRIREALEVAAETSPDDNEHLYLAHISASVGVLPIEAAAGPLNRTVVGMNDMTGQWLEDFAHVEGATKTGVVIFDFPGKEVVDAVLRWNKPLVIKG